MKGVRFMMGEEREEGWNWDFCGCGWGGASGGQGSARVDLEVC